MYEWQCNCVQDEQSEGHCCGNSMEFQAPGHPSMRLRKLQCGGALRGDEGHFYVCHAIVLPINKHEAETSSKVPMRYSEANHKASSHLASCATMIFVATPDFILRRQYERKWFRVKHTSEWNKLRNPPVVNIVVDSLWARS